MSKQTFTPGPWHVGSKFTVGPLSAEDDQTFGMLMSLADIYGENREANARLIAAAPDLLAALEAFVKMTNNDQIMCLNDDRAALIDALTNANLAVAKATRSAT